MILRIAQKRIQKQCKCKCKLETTAQNEEKLYYFKKIRISQLFKEYHEQHAQFRLIHVSANLKEL